MSQAAIEAARVSKRFRVPVDHSPSLQHRFAHPISSLRYRILPALNDISLTVPYGQFLGVTGANGCGKSTLLKVLARIYAPDSGSVRINGRVAPFLELGVGFKYELTARENIVLAGSVLGLTRAQLTRRVAAVLDFAELEGFADQKLRTFSSGMVMRLAFSVAALADADILLMDEVLAVGDAHFRKKCFDVFGYYKRSGRTVVLVTHDLSALELYCDRVVLMDAGHIVADGRPGDVTREYRELVAEREDTSQPAAVPLPAMPTNRRGTLDVEITGVRTLDAGGGTHYSFFTGRPMTVAIDYKVNRAVGPVVCALLFKRSDGHPVCAPNTKSSGFVFQAQQASAEGTVYYRVRNLGLLSATYGISVALFDDQINRTYDRMVQEAVFQVTDAAGTPGEFELGGTWDNEVRGPSHTNAVPTAIGIPPLGGA